MSTIAYTATVIGGVITGGYLVRLLVNFLRTRLVLVWRTKPQLPQRPPDQQPHEPQQGRDVEACPPQTPQRKSEPPMTTDTSKETTGQPAATTAESSTVPDVKLSTGQRWLAAGAVVGGVVVSFCGYATNFSSLTEYARTKSWAIPEALPIGLDAAIPTLLACDYIATVKGANFPFLRWSAWGLTAYTVLAGTIAGAARGDHVDWGTVALKGIMPVLGVVMIEFVRLWALYKKNLLEKRNRDSIPFARWVASPWPTLMMKRQMVLWNELSYPRAIVREACLLYAKSLLEARYGTTWKKDAPLSLRHRVDRGQLPTSVVSAIKSSVEDGTEDWQEAMERWISAEAFRAQSMFGNRDSDRRPDTNTDHGDSIDGSALNGDRVNGNRRNGRSGTASRTKQTARAGNGTGGNRTGTGDTRKVGRPARGEDEMAALRAKARAVFARFLQEAGKPPTAEELREPLKIGKPLACDLLRELKQRGPAAEATELILTGRDGHA